MAKTGHKSLRSVQRYVKPGLAAVHQATETLSSPPSPQFRGLFARNFLDTTGTPTSRVIADDRVLAVASGALGNTGLAATAATGTLGDVLRGDIPAHTPGTSVYAPVGLPW